MNDIAASAIMDLRGDVNWAKLISAAWQSSFNSILESGRLLIEAKAALPHGEFIAMIEASLPFDASTAQRLMKIAADKRIANPAHVQLLPPHWGTLYELTKLPDEVFEEKIADGTINPKMQRKAVVTPRQLKPKKRTRSPRRDPNVAGESQHDRDLRMLLGVWEATCETARDAFIKIVT